MPVNIHKAPLHFGISLIFQTSQNMCGVITKTALKVGVIVINQTDYFRQLNPL